MHYWIAQGKVEVRRTASGSARIYVDTLWRDAKPTTTTTEEPT